VNVLLLLALLLMASLWAAKGGRLIRMPQVVGFVVAGVVLGPSVLGWIGSDAVRHLDALSRFALAIIGFGIGAELKWPLLKTLGRAIVAIVPLEAFGAFLLVGLGVFLLTRDWPLSLLLGAMASATAPAGTANILREYKARGPMTSTLFAVVGLDDAVSLIIFGFAMPVARLFLAPTPHVSWGHVVAQPFVEIGLSIGLGLAIGVVLLALLRWMRSRGESLVLVLAALLIASGAADWWHLSPILTTMTAGMLTANVRPIHQARMEHSLNDWAQPLYLVFFALVGVRLELSWGLIQSVGWVVAAYVVLRTAGKGAGVYFGARIGRAAPAVRRYAWMGLMSQAGVAIGLAIFSYQELARYGPAAEAVGHQILSTVTLTTFVLEIIGPIFLRLALKKSGESPVLARASEKKGAA